MPFNSLLLRGFIPDGKWEEHEAGVVISNELQNDMRYLLFSSDNDDFRKYLERANKRANKRANAPVKCCDLICIAQKGGVEITKGKSPKRTDTSIIVCFIELKDGKDKDKDIKDAADQILNTYELVKYGISNMREEENLGKNITWQALIVRGGELLGATAKNENPNYSYNGTTTKNEKLNHLCKKFHDNVLVAEGKAVNLTNILKL